MTLGDSLGQEMGRALGDSLGQEMGMTLGDSLGQEMGMTLGDSLVRKWADAGRQSRSGNGLMQDQICWGSC